MCRYVLLHPYYEWRNIVILRMGMNFIIRNVQGMEDGHWSSLLFIYFLDYVVSVICATCLLFHVKLFSAVNMTSHSNEHLLRKYTRTLSIQL